MTTNPAPNDGKFYRLDEMVGSAAARRLTYTVVDKLQKNVVIVPVGGGRRSRVNPAFLVEVESPTAAVAETVPYEPPLFVGQVVRYVGPGTRIPRVLYVVIGDSATGYRLAKLGGNNGKYWRSVPQKHLQVVDLDV